MLQVLVRELSSSIDRGFAMCNYTLTKSEFGLARSSIKGRSLMKLLGIALMFLGVASFAGATSVPEIDPGSAGSALALLSGALLVVRARRKK
jgi:hypothetical protein